MATLKELYTALRADGAPVPESYEAFESYMTSGPQHGYAHRKEIYDALKADGAPLPSTYEEFSKTLFAPVNKKTSVATDIVQPKPTIISNENGQAADSLLNYLPGGNPVTGRKGAEDPFDLSMPSEKVSGHTPFDNSKTGERLAGIRAASSNAEQLTANAKEKASNVAEYYRKGGGFNGQKPVEGSVRVDPVSGKAERTYLTPSGERITNNALAEMETRRVNDHYDNMTVSGQLRRAGRDLEDLYRKRDAAMARYEEEHPTGEGYTVMGSMSAGMPIAMNNGSGYDEEVMALNAAIRQTQERIRTLQRENDRNEGKDVGFWRGFFDTVGNFETWDFGVSSFSDAMSNLRASKEVSDRSNGESQEKTAVQRANDSLLEQSHLTQQAEAAYGGNDSFWNRAGVMTGEMLPFMLDFAVMGGSGGGASMITRNLDAMLLRGLHKAAQKIARNKAVQWTTKALGAMPEDLLYRAPLMTNTVQGMKTSADIIDRKLGDVVVREDGTYDFSNDKTWGSAIWQGEANAIIENYSEMFGTHLEGLMSLKSIGKIADTFGAKRLSGILTKASNSELAGIAGTMQKHLNRLGVSDYFGEVGEEYYGQLWRTMLNLDDAYKQNPDGSRTNLLLDGQFHGDIWGGMALSMGLMGAGKYTVSAAAYGSMKHRVNKTDTRASEIFTPEVWEGWRERIDGTTNDKIGEMADAIVADPKLTDEQREAAMNYIEASMNLRGFNLASVARQRGGEMSEDEAAANESYMDGYSATTPQEMNDAKRMLDLQRQRLASTLSEDVVQDFDNDPVGTLSSVQETELRQIAADYVNAKMVYDGMIQRVRDDVDGRIAQSDTMIDSRINRETGMIQPATMKIDDRKVYIVNGTVSMYDDGNGVDARNSSESIIIRDAETGKVEFADPTQLLNVDEAIDAEAEKETARNQIYDEIAVPAANNIDGILSFTPGDTYSILDGEGNIQPVSVLGQTADENGMPVDGYVDVQHPDGTIESVATKELQQAADAAGAQRVAQFEEERQAQRSAEEEARRQADTPQQQAQPTVPNSEESVPNSEENAVQTPQNTPKAVSTDDGFIPIDSNIIPDQTEQTAKTPEEAKTSALSQIPKDQSGEVLYEQTEPDTAWDALVEQTEGDEDIAISVIEQTISEKEEELKKLSKQKPQGGLSTSQKIQAEKDKKNAMDIVQQSIDHWKRMAVTKQRRQAEENAIRDAEIRKRAEEARINAEQERAAREEAERIEREALKGVPDWSHDTPRDARARGYRRNGPQKVNRQENVAALQGKEIEVKFGENELPKGHATIIDAATLQPSHIQGSRNPFHFLDESQPKERDDAASVLSAQKIAGNIRPEEISSSVTAYTGAPTVNLRGETIQGNSRSDALRLMYESYPEQATKYKQYLIDHAGDFGLTPEQIASVERPVLVNMLDVADDEAIHLGQFVAQDTESGGVERIKPKNTVRRVGDGMTSFANILLRSENDEESVSQLIDANGMEALKWMAARGHISETQYQSAFDSRGNITEEAKNDLKGMLFENVFTGGSTQLSEMFQRMPSKAQRAILATAHRDHDSAKDDRMRDELQQSIIAFSDMAGYPDVAAASNVESAIRGAETWSRQYAIDDVSGEGRLPSGNFSNFAIRLAAIYKGGSQKFIQQTFNDLYDSIQGTAQDTLFEVADKTPKSLSEAVRKVLGIEYQPVKQNDNGNIRSDAVDIDTPQGETGRSGSIGNA